MRDNIRRFIFENFLFGFAISCLFKPAPDVKTQNPPLKKPIYLCLQKLQLTPKVEVFY